MSDITEKYLRAAGLQAGAASASASGVLTQEPTHMKYLRKAEEAQNNRGATGSGPMKASGPTRGTATASTQQEPVYMKYLRKAEEAQKKTTGSGPSRTPAPTVAAQQENSEEAAYKKRMQGMKTDVSGVAELLERQREIYTPSQADAYEPMSMSKLAEGQQISRELERTRSALKSEGWTDAEIYDLEAYLTRQRNAEQAKTASERYRQEAQGRSGLGNLAVNTVTGLAAGAGYLDIASQYLFAGKDAITGEKTRVDYNSESQALHQIGEATMQGQMDKLLEKYGVTDEHGNRDLNTEGKIRAGAYQLFASMGQSAAVAGLTAMGVPAAMLLLAGSAATSTAHEYHEKGFSDGTALLMGGIAGAAEYVTEKIGMDELFRTRDLSTTKGIVKGLLKNIGNQAMAEGGEEVLSTVINTLADVLVNGDKNQLTGLYQAYLLHGYSDAEARKAAARSWLGGVWQDFYMGALSGALFGAAGSGFHGMRNAVTDTRTGRVILDSNQAAELRERIGKLDADIREAAVVPTLEENAGARQLGAAQRGLERAGVMENMRGELSDKGEESASPALLSGLYASSQQQEQRLTRPEKKALRGSEAAQELAKAWNEQWKDGSVPAPFEGMAEYVVGKAGKNEEEKKREKVKEEILSKLPQPKKVGKTTTISNPYNGTVPTQSYVKGDAVPISNKSVETAKTMYAEAEKEAKETGGFLKTILSRLYKDFKGPKSVPVYGMKFEGKDYVVDVPNGLPGKLASQGTTGIEYTILDDLAEIIKNGEYLGSGYGIENNKPKKNITRYDYFETEVTIEGKPHVVRWEVENVPGANNYKTHRLTSIEIDPASADGPPAKSGRNPTETGSKKDQSDPISIISDTPENINPQNEEKTVVEAPASSGETPQQGAEPSSPLRGASPGGGSQQAETRTVEVKDAAAELVNAGKARVENDTGRYDLSVKQKSDGHWLARALVDGKLDEARTFGSAQEAAEYLQSYVEGRTRGTEDGELDREKSEYQEPQSMEEQLFDRDAYRKEAVRQKKNKAAKANTDTLKERVRRTQEELNALRRLEKQTGLTQEQKDHRADLQETLEIMNDELESRKKKRSEKKKKAAEKKAMGNKPTRSVQEARKSLLELFHTATGERAEIGKAIEEKLVKLWQEGKLTEQDRTELFDLLMEKGEVRKLAEDVFHQIHESLWRTRIYVSEADRKGYGDNWKELAQRAFAVRIWLTSDPNDKDADVHNQEMAEIYGEGLFPTDAAAQDMLENLIEKAHMGKDTKQSLKDAIAEEAEHERTDPDEIFADYWKKMEEILRTASEKMGLEVDLKDRTAAQLADERARWEKRMEDRAQRRRESELREKLLHGLQRLQRAKNKAGPKLKAQIEEVLRDIDTTARQITLSGIEDLQALQRAYEDARKAAGYEDAEHPGNWIPNPYVEERLARLTQKHVNDMNIDEVIELGQMVSAMENSLKTQNQMIGEEWDSTVEEEAKGVREEVTAAKGAKPGFIQKWFMEEHLSPRRFLEMLGGWKNGAMQKLARSLEEGQTRALDFQRRAIQSFDSFLESEEHREWLKTASGKKAQWTKYAVVDGIDENGATVSEIELTPMMKVSLYLHSRNMDNLRHIQTGGMAIPDKALYQKGKIAEAYALGKRVKLNPDSVRKIGGMLTPTEKAFAEHIIQVFDKLSKDAINEVSLQLDGFERAGVENYFPIETDRNFIRSDVAGEARAQTVEGIGSIANERVHASNPLMLIDASDVLARQIDKVSRYYGYAIPIRNFQAVNNYVFHEEGNPFASSVKELIGKKWGSGAEQYITKMLADIQSGGKRSGDPLSRALSALRGNLAGSTLMFNPSVAVSQVASYPGAAQAVGWDGLAAGLAFRRVDPKVIEKYSPLYWYRNQGNSTQELGDYMRERSMGQKLPWLLNWIQKMDSFTVRRLWAASEYRVSKDNPKLERGSDAYYKAVAEVFNRAVYDTQPNYTNMERAQILRSDSDTTRFLTMYKTVPLQYYGMMVEAAGRMQAAAQSGNKAEIDKARKYALDTFGGLLAANSVYVAIKAAFKGLRGKDKDYKDEEGRRTAGSVGKQLMKDLLETYAGSVIGGAEALSVVKSLANGGKFYGPEMSSLSYVEDIVGATQSIIKACQDQDPRKAAKAIKDASETLGTGFGIPAKNFETYTIGILGNLIPKVGLEYNNLFGGIDKSDLKNVDQDALGMAAGLILSNRTGERFSPSVTEELARLYSTGETSAIPTSIPKSFTEDGVTVEIKNRSKYSDTWGSVVGDTMEELLTSDDYRDASDKEKARLVDRLYEYATVQARKTADPDYNPEGNSTYGWTTKADTAVEAGIPLSTAICAIQTMGNMTADKDEDGNSVSGSKKEKVCQYIDALDLTDKQKDTLYLLAGYKENSLEYTPWHDGTKKKSGGTGRGGSSKSSSVKKLKTGGGTAKGYVSTGRQSKTSPEWGIDVSDFFREPSRSGGASGGRAGRTSGKTAGEAGDATERIYQIVNKYYGGNVLLALMDGGKKVRAKERVDFKLK